MSWPYYPLPTYCSRATVRQEPFLVSRDGRRFLVARSIPKDDLVTIVSQDWRTIDLGGDEVIEVDSIVINCPPAVLRFKDEGEHVTAPRGESGRYLPIADLRALPRHFQGKESRRAGTHNGLRSDPPTFCTLLSSLT